MAARSPEIEVSPHIYYRNDVGEAQRDISPESRTLLALKNHTIEDQISVAVGVTDQTYTISANLCFLSIEETTGQSVKMRLQTAGTQMLVNYLLICNADTEEAAFPAGTLYFSNVNDSICRVKITKAETTA